MLQPTTQNDKYLVTGVFFYGRKGGEKVGSQFVNVDIVNGNFFSSFFLALRAFFEFISAYAPQLSLKSSNGVLPKNCNGKEMRKPQKDPLTRFQFSSLIISEARRA